MGIRELGIVLSLALCAGCGGGSPETTPDVAPRPRNLLLVSIDTLRADRLGCYGAPRDTSPNLDRFAARAVRFANVYAESCWTIPSHVTILSGLYPTSHQVVVPQNAPSPEVPLAAEILGRAGFATFASVGGGWMCEEQGFARGFGFFDSYVVRRKGFERSIEIGFEVLARTPESTPFFGFLHTYDVHCPYDPPEPYRSMFATSGRSEFDAAGKCGNPDLNGMGLDAAQAVYLSDLYDGGVRWVDAAFGKLLAGLEERALFDDTVIIVLSDHGEEFLEHGKIGHEGTLNGEALRVPLLVYAPGVAPGVVDAPVGLVDVLPTLLELLDVPAPRELDGRSLVPLMSGASDAARPAGRFAEVDHTRRLRSWTTTDRKLVRDLQSGDVSLFDIAADPFEQRNLALAEPSQRDALTRSLADFMKDLESRRREAAPAKQLSPDKLDELRRLGY